jgi:hypothetical protein
VDTSLSEILNLLRSHLSAAFEYAEKADNDPTRLAPNELHRYWNGLDKVGFPEVRSLLKFDLALGGQRGSRSSALGGCSKSFSADTAKLLSDPSHPKGGAIGRTICGPLTLDFLSVNELPSSGSEESASADPARRCVSLRNIRPHGSREPQQN